MVAITQEVKEVQKMQEGTDDHAARVSSIIESMFAPVAPAVARNVHQPTREQVARLLDILVSEEYQTRATFEIGNHIAYYKCFNAGLLQAGERKWREGISYQKHNITPDGRRVLAALAEEITDPEPEPIIEDKYNVEWLYWLNVAEMQAELGREQWDDVQAWRYAGGALMSVDFFIAKNRVFAVLAWLHDYAFSADELAELLGVTTGYVEMQLTNACAYGFVHRAKCGGVTLYQAWQRSNTVLNNIAMQNAAYHANAEHYAMAQDWLDAQIADETVEACDSMIAAKQAQNASVELSIIGWFVREYTSQMEFAQRVAWHLHGGRQVICTGSQTWTIGGVGRVAESLSGCLATHKVKHRWNVSCSKLHGYVIVIEAAG